MIFQPAEMMQPDVPAAAVVGVVAGKPAEQRIDGHFQDVARATRIDFEARSVGPHAHDTTAAELEPAAVGPFGFHKAEIADRQI